LNISGPSRVTVSNGSVMIIGHGVAAGPLVTPARAHARLCRRCGLDLNDANPRRRACARPRSARHLKRVGSVAPQRAHVPRAETIRPWPSSCARCERDSCYAR
jgi:hypothetical protein